MVSSLTGFSVVNAVMMLAGLAVVVIIIVLVIVGIAKNAKQSSADNKAERQEAEARLAEKREVKAKFGIIYYAKFNLTNGEVYEFRISDTQYAKLVQGTDGQLVYQGTRFVSFVKNSTKDE